MFTSISLNNSLCLWIQNITNSCNVVMGQYSYNTLSVIFLGQRDSGKTPFTPIGAPRILDDDIFCTIFFSVSNSYDGMISLSAAILWFNNSFMIILKLHAISIESQESWSDRQSTLQGIDIIPPNSVMRFNIEIIWKLFIRWFPR